MELKEIKVVRMESEPHLLYSNNVEITTNVYEFQFMFSGNVFDAETKTYKKNNMVAVFMSPQHAKATHNVLSKHIELYENAYGEILLPKVEGENGQ